jgi:hypothetical protein
VIVQMVLFYLPGGGQYPNGQGQVKVGALLADIGRCQIDHHTVMGPLKSIVDQGGFNSLLAFPNGMISQSNDKKTNPLRYMYLNGNQDRPNSLKCAAVCLDEHEETWLSPFMGPGTLLSFSHIIGRRKSWEYFEYFL